MSRDETTALTSDRRWNEFLRWSRRMADTVDLNKEEHSYKRDLAKRLQVVRSRFLERVDGWESELVAALQSTHLLDWRNTRQIKEAAAQRPDALATAVATIWEGSEADARALAAFDAPVRRAVEAIAPGNVVAFGSVLLMARSPGEFPPYRPGPVTRWRELVGGELPDKNAVARYNGLLVLTDELIDRAPAEGILLADRLEAQGLAWTVLRSKIDTLPFSQPEKHAFASWRGEKETLADLDEVALEFASDAEAEGVIAGDLDTRERTLAEIHVRRGQSAFRQSLLDAYMRRCAVTGSSTVSVLEAAHISPYRGRHSHRVANGLLLRADIHTLFDLCQLTVVVEGDNHIVRVSPHVTEAAYRSLDGRPLRLPKTRSGRPSRDALGQHNSACDWLEL